MAHSVQDAFVIAVEQQAKERLERLSQLKRIKPVDMNKLSDQRPGSPSRPGPSRESSQSKEQWNGLIDHNSVFVTSLGSASEGPSTSGGKPGPSVSGSSGSQQPTPRLTNGHGSGSGSGTAAAGAAAAAPAGGPPDSRGASFDEADAPEVELKQDLGEADLVASLPPQPSALQDRRASSPFTNGRTELLIPGDPGDAPHRMRTTALVEHPSQEEWSVR
ncbi:hypothetical protein FOCC_FOCC004645 [Frankliniella occidentalis]|nr:hypothetical protein FOCC_FOCC004645 [Frankliniella occidentalis]